MPDSLPEALIQFLQARFRQRLVVPLDLAAVRFLLWPGKARPMEEKPTAFLSPAFAPGQRQRL